VSPRASLALGLVALLSAAVMFGGYAFYSYLGSRPGYLVLDGDSLNLSDVQVTLDGKRLGNLSGSLARFAVEPGRHVLVLKRRGYLPVEKTFEVARGKEWHLNPVWIRPEGLPADLPAFEARLLDKPVAGC
jgi:hypothetical protein